MARTTYDAANPLLDRDEYVGGMKFTAYVPEVAWRVCEMIAEGKTFDEIFSEENRGTVCAQTTFFRWVLNYGECRRAYLMALEISSYVLEDLAMQEAKKIASAPGSAQRVSAFRAYIEQLKWSASKRNPKAFSDKAPVNVTVPIQINTGLDMGDGQGKEAPKVQGGENVYAIKATVEDIEEIDQESLIPTITAEEIAAAQRERAKDRFVPSKALKGNPERAREIASGPKKRVLTPRGPKRVYKRKGTENE